jgi:hypothetical protein
MPKLKDFKVGEFRIGPTGQVPQGRAGADDDGEIYLGLAADHQHAIVRIVFGTPIAWIGLPAEEARALAHMLVEMADELDRRRT